MGLSPGEISPTEMNLTPWERIGSIRFSPIMFGCRVTPSIVGTFGP